MPIDTAAELAVEVNPAGANGQADEVLSIFGRVHHEGAAITGLDNEIVIGGITYSLLPKDPNGLIDVSGLDFNDPTTRMVFLCGKDVSGSPWQVPDAVRLFGEIVPSPADMPPEATYRQSKIVDIQPDTPANERIISEGPARLFGFTRIGESGHSVRTAQVGGNVVYEMINSTDNSIAQLTRSRLLAIWHGSGAAK